MPADPSVMEKDPLAYRGYWGWQVYYRTTRGDIWLPPGYAQADAIPVDQYCATVSHCPPL